MFLYQNILDLETCISGGVGFETISDNSDQSSTEKQFEIGSSDSKLTTTRPITITKSSTFTEVNAKDAEELSSIPTTTTRTR